MITDQYDDDAAAAVAQKHEAVARKRARNDDDDDCWVSKAPCTGDRCYLTVYSVTSGRPFDVGAVDPHTTTLGEIKDRIREGTRQQKHLMLDKTRPIQLPDDATLAACGFTTAMTSQLYVLFKVRYTGG